MLVTRCSLLSLVLALWGCNESGLLLTGNNDLSGVRDASGDDGTTVDPADLAAAPDLPDLSPVAQVSVELSAQLLPKLLPGGDYESWLHFGAADVNADGKLDLVVQSSTDGVAPGSQGVFTYLGVGDGSFGAPVRSSLGLRGYRFALGLLYGADALPDVVVPVQTKSIVVTYAGTGDGHFIVRQGTTAAPEGLYITSVGDFNGDGKQDVLGRAQGDIVVLLGAASTILHDAVINKFGLEGFRLATGDFDQDGNDDVAVHDRMGHLNLYWSAGQGLLQPGPSYRTLDLLSNAVGVGRFTRSGRIDLAVSADLTGDVECFPNQGGRSFGLPVASGEGSTRAYAVADLNRDGLDDLVMGAGGVMAVVVADGSGRFKRATNFSLPAKSDVLELLAGDFNGDRLPDIAVLNDQPTGGVTVYLNTSR